MKRLLAVFVIATLLVRTPAQAWHNRGHMAVARIAWLKLVNDGLDRKAARILESHPHKAMFLAAGRPDGVDEDEWMFVQAATWADWVRRPAAPGLDEQSAQALADEFNKPVWHYVNLPHIHPAESGNFDATALRTAVLEPEFDSQGSPRHVLAAIKCNRKRFETPDISPKDRAVALCWLLHLVGDLHQPLHAVGLIGSKTTFDAEVLADLPYPAVQARVLAWVNDPSFQRQAFASALESKEVLSWAEESLALAKSVVYTDEGQFLKAIPLPLRYARADLERMTAPVPSGRYQTTADGVAQRRIVLAGDRLDR